MNQLKSFLEWRKQADGLSYQRNLSVIDYVEREFFFYPRRKIHCLLILAV